MRHERSFVAVAALVGGLSTAVFMTLDVRVGAEPAATLLAQESPPEDPHERAAQIDRKIRELLEIPWGENVLEALIDDKGMLERLRSLQASLAASVEQFQRTESRETVPQRQCEAVANWSQVSEIKFYGEGELSEGRDGFLWLVGGEEAGVRIRFSDGSTSQYGLTGRGAVRRDGTTLSVWPVYLVDR